LRKVHTSIKNQWSKRRSVSYILNPAYPFCQVLDNRQYLGATMTKKGEANGSFFGNFLYEQIFSI
jgi:hypothetical protein